MIYNYAQKHAGIFYWLQQGVLLFVVCIVPVPSFFPYCNACVFFIAQQVQVALAFSCELFLLYVFQPPVRRTFGSLHFGNVPQRNFDRKRK